MPADTMTTPLQLIPETKQPAVRRALIETFGVDHFEEISELTLGLSTALVFKIVVKGSPYVLRIITRTDAISEPTRQYGVMKSAADIGIAPRLLYASTEERISIIDFIDPKPFQPNAAVLIAEAIRKLHSLPPIPKSVAYIDVMEGLVRKFQDGKLLAEQKTGDLFRLYGELSKVYPRDESDYVTCHNDLKADNILFDGSRIWFVDWEAAFLNDRYLDLAIAANFFVENEADEEAFLSTYFGEPPGEYRHARFYLMQQALHTYYTAFLAVLVASSGKPIDTTITPRGFRDFHSRMLTGEILLTTDETKLEFANVHLNEALRCMHSMRFTDALAIVADYHRRM